MGCEAAPPRSPGTAAECVCGCRAQNLLFNAAPESLFCQRSHPEPRETGSLLQRAALLLGGFYSKESSLMRAAQSLYGSVTQQATEPALLRGARGAGRRRRRGGGVLPLWVGRLVV